MWRLLWLQLHVWQAECNSVFLVAIKADIIINFKGKIHWEAFADRSYERGGVDLRSFTTLYIRLSVLLLAAFLVFSVEVMPAEATRMVRVGYFSLHGYQETDSLGYHRGYGYEFLQRLSQYSGWEYEYVPSDSYGDALEDLKSGKVDIVTSTTMSPSGCLSFPLPRSLLVKAVP